MSSSAVSSIIVGLDPGVSTVGVDSTGESNGHSVSSDHKGEDSEEQARCVVRTRTRAPLHVNNPLLLFFSLPGCCRTTSIGIRHWLRIMRSISRAGTQIFLRSGQVSSRPSIAEGEEEPE